MARSTSVITPGVYSNTMVSIERVVYVVFIGLSSTDLILWRQPLRCQSLKNTRFEKNCLEKKIQGGILYLRAFKGIQISLDIIANSIAFQLLFDTNI